ncbi:hypothetical protein BpHYR1_025278 [Brachionus plicatilis]|uniref:Uncharacterized protein n=1 Tax=Brachionus plicatilis TaxID=10195 RepID=A0A3M7SL36_BRAPC|nr:hypothetical protein BpHYR1_025278 [Brachionus plicatilis]
MSAARKKSFKLNCIVDLAKSLLGSWIDPQWKKINNSIDNKDSILYGENLTLTLTYKKYKKFKKNVTTSIVNSSISSRVDWKALYSRVVVVIKS